MDEYTPWTLLALFFAGFVALTIGTKIASARHDAAMQLFGICVTSNSPIVEVSTCGMGLLLFVGIMGTLGVFWLVFTAVR